MLRVLMVISEAPPVVSGISRTAGNLMAGLAELGYHVDTISANDVPRLIRGEVRLSSMLWKAPRVLGGILSSYDVVHVHGPVPTFSDVALLLSILQARGGHPAVVYTHHSEIDLPDIRPLCALYNRMHKRLARHADQVIVGTPAYARDLSRYIPADQIAVVPFSVDGDWYDHRTPKADHFTVLFVGQLRPYKGVETLIDAAEQVQGVAIRIVGGGYQEEYYRSMVARRGLEHVTFTGRVSDAELFDAYSKAHVVVLPSTTRAEAFGLVLLEGMVAGCVPVASQLPGVVDVVGDAGFCFPIGDAVALAEVFARLRDNPELWQRYSRRAQERVRLYSRRRMIFWHHTLYQRLDALRRFNAILHTKGEDMALGSLVRDTMGILHASSGSIMLIDAGHQMLKLQAASGLPDHVKLGAQQSLAHGVAGLVARTNIPLRLPAGYNLSLDHELVAYRQRSHIHSSLSVPMQAGKHTLGVMNVSSHVVERDFGDDELRWLHTVGRLVAGILTCHRSNNGTVLTGRQRQNRSAVPIAAVGN